MGYRDRANAWVSLTEPQRANSLVDGPIRGDGKVSDSTETVWTWEISPVSAS
jgi:hypothetical protein